MQEERASFSARLLGPEGCHLVDTFRAQFPITDSSVVAGYTFFYSGCGNAAQSSLVPLSCALALA